MKRILLSAFACDPTKGSEPSCGWNWAVGLAGKGFEVHCITRGVSEAGISTKVIPPNLKITYLDLPYGLEKLYSASQSAQYFYYILWQFAAYKVAAELHRVNRYDMTHHITFGSLQMGSFLYKLDAPLLFGPAGGGQMAPAAFKEYFGEAWPTEKKRRIASRALLKFNPACKAMLKKAAVVLVSNEETLHIAESYGVTNAHLELDVGLPEWFFPDRQIEKATQKGKLKLLWVGRLMPRKGILFLLELMRCLKDRPTITLTIVGDGPMKDIFLAKVREYALENTVIWKGRVPFEMVREAYMDHDVFVFTSLRESGGVQILEAMAFGMPVVTLDLHGPSLIVDGTRGVKCACDTPETAIKNMKQAILDLSNDPDLVGRLSVGALNFALRNEWKKRIDDIVDRYYCPELL